MTFVFSASGIRRRTHSLDVSVAWLWTFDVIGEPCVVVFAHDVGRGGLFSRRTQSGIPRARGIVTGVPRPCRAPIQHGTSSTASAPNASAVRSAPSVTSNVFCATLVSALLNSAQPRVTE